jgi:hypothetical protein
MKQTFRKILDFGFGAYDDIIFKKLNDQLLSAERYKFPGSSLSPCVPWCITVTVLKLNKKSSKKAPRYGQEAFMSYTKYEQVSKRQTATPYCVIVSSAFHGPLPQNNGKHMLFSIVYCIIKDH